MGGHDWMGSTVLRYILPGVVMWEEGIPLACRSIPKALIDDLTAVICPRMRLHERRMPVGANYRNVAIGRIRQ